jgi:DNA-binding transcriptional ArsR family regulator
VELAAVGAALGDPTRTAIIIILLDGRARTAGELAGVAGVTPQTASSHIAKLVDAGLLIVTKQGRHRYHNLARPEAVGAIEGLTNLAAGLRRYPRRPGPRDRALREGRTCYDHFAGRLGVAIADAFVGRKGIIDNGKEFVVTTAGERDFARLGVDVPCLKLERRPLCRRCIDWSERRPHIAGLVGAQLTANAIAGGWVQRIEGSRAVRLTNRGRKVFVDALDLTLANESPVQPPQGVT